MVAAVVRAYAVRSTYHTTPAVRIVRRSSYTMQKNEKGGV